MYKTNKIIDLKLTEEDIKHLLKSEEDIEMGRVRNAYDVFEEWEEKFGVQFENNRRLSRRS